MLKTTVTAVAVLVLGVQAGCPRAQPVARTLAVDRADRQILSVLSKLDRRSAGMMNVPRQDGRLLRLLVGSIGARRVVEIGTSNGYSGIWIALALRRTGGHLTTFEIDARRAALARENFKRAGVASLTTVVVGDAHKLVASRVRAGVDLVFIDADKQGYLDYLRKLLPKVRRGGLIVAHNMRYPRPNPAFIHAITTSAALETMFFNMDGPGVAVSLKKGSPAVAGRSGSKQKSSR